MLNVGNFACYLHRFVITLGLNIIVLKETMDLNTFAESRTAMGHCNRLCASLLPWA